MIKFELWDSDGESPIAQFTADGLFYSNNVACLQNVGCRNVAVINLAPGQYIRTAEGK